MTKQEIIDSVEKGIEGQGTMVDLGGVLPKILKAIVDALPEGGAEPAITINAISLTEESIESAATALGITVEELLSLPKQSVIGMTNDSEYKYELSRVFYQYGGSDVAATFGVNGVGNYFAYFTVILSNSTVTTSFDVL